MSIHCLKCGGSGILINGERCPDCSKEVQVTSYVPNIPIQYQGKTYDKSFLPEYEQDGFGTYMENLLKEIDSNLSFYQKNHIICSRVNTGKTVWSYDLLSRCISRGYDCPRIYDVLEVRDILSSYTDKSTADVITSARCVIMKIPRDAQPWVFDSVASIVDRRVRSNGFTIFLFDGSKYDLFKLDKYGRLHEIEGNGSYNSIKITDYYKGVSYESV